MKRWSLVATIVLTLPAVSALFLSQQRATDLLDLAHYNDVFDASQLQAELLRLNAELGRYAYRPSSDGADLVRLRFEILMNHADMLRHAAVSQTMELMVAGLSADIDKTLKAVEPMIGRLDASADAAAVLFRTEHLEAALAQATGFVGEQSAMTFADTGNEFRSVRDMLLVLVAGLLTAAMSLAVVLWRQHAEMRSLAYRDSLTGLPNRLAFNAELDRARGHGAASVLLADVDHFKEINDSFGHDVGDALLQQIASRLAAAVPEAGLIARLGGDEFAVLLHGAEGTAVAERLCAAAAEPFRVGDLLLRSGLSVGIVVDDAGPRDPVSLLKRADLALYTAKAAGRGRQCLFDPALERGFATRRQMEEDLRAAVADDAIEVHYQPLVDLATGRPLACEALARWEHPRHGRVSPADFIALAERSPLIVALGHRVLVRACTEAATWPPAIGVAVNVSAQQILETDFAERVTGVLAQTGLDPHRLELEITESVLLRTDAGVLGTIGRLRRLGVSFALDDFGTGYSSLSRLHHLPLDKLKIDQSFTRAMETSGEALGIVETIIDLAGKLGMVTTAEGVETESQNALLLRAGCHQGQGYLFDRPMPPDLCRLKLAESVLHPMAGTPPARRLRDVA